MIDDQPALTIRLASPDDISAINELDCYSDSPTRDIHRDIEKYFGSVDPSTHEHNYIFLAEIAGQAVAKAELMFPSSEAASQVGYVRRVVVHPAHRGKGLAKQLMQYVIDFARHTGKIDAVDLHVWEGNQAAIHLYEALGFTLQHRELYYRLPFKGTD
jgi:ribosomal protein S18 acetylase RimI-like enzyme